MPSSALYRRHMWAFKIYILNKASIIIFKKQGDSILCGKCTDRHTMELIAD